MERIQDRINEQSPWQHITEGNKIFEAATSRDFCTGEWRTSTPVFDSGKCTQCLLCVPVCPDSSIPVSAGKRDDFDYDHCKGCGICAKVCPFGAIRLKNQRFFNPKFGAAPKLEPLAAPKEQSQHGG